ncbi:unnamed protein product, partial [Didymodactylos carnosus]
MNSNSLSSTCRILLNATWKNSGVIHFSNAGKPPSSLSNPLDLFLDNKNNYIYIVGINNSRIQRFARENNRSIETVAKLGVHLPQSIWVGSNSDADLNIYISYNLVVRKWFAPDYSYRIVVPGQWKNSVDNSIGPIGTKV